MMRSMYAGVSGLKNHQTRLDVIGNNIANVNTTGFKTSRVVFQDMLSQTIRSGTAASSTGSGGTNAAQVGLGMIIGAIDTLQTQGNFESTGKSTDMAIQGNGFFVLNNGVSVRYSRDGAFDLNSDNDLVNASNGYKVQGWSAVDNALDTTGVVGNINIPVGSRMVSSATSNISLCGNLDASGTTASTGTVCNSGVFNDAAGAAADADVLLTGLENVDGDSLLAAGDVITIGGKKGNIAVTNQTLTVGATTKVQDLLDAIAETYGIYDDGTAGVSVNASGNIVITGNEGTENALTDITLSAASAAGTAKADFNTVSAPDSDNGFTQTAAADGASIASSMVAYDSLGVAHTINVIYTKTSDDTWTWNADCDDQASGGVNVGHGTVTFSSSGVYEDSTGSINIVLDSGATTPLAVSLSEDALTQLSSDSAVSVSEQDGYAPGTLESFSIGSDGVITGVYTNGMTETLAQIALANFANPSGLTKDGNNLYSQATSSGVAQVGGANSGGRGTISSGVLEMSNVDLAQAFTDMITTQRGFQANAKIITTSDDMLQELVNLKR